VSAALLLPYQATPDAPRKRFTRQEVDRLIDLGIFDGQRFELIDGELFDKMGQKPPHAEAIRTLARLLSGILGLELVQVQLPIEAGGADRDRSLPEPDVAVLVERKPEYRRRHPRGDELILVVEISDTTLAFDLSRKAELYANAGVPVYWVVDLKRRMLVKHREPRGGFYRLVESFVEGEGVAIEGRTEIIPVTDMLPASD
jgi:Uma2 family endonuclease